MNPTPRDPVSLPLSPKTLIQKVFPLTSWDPLSLPLDPWDTVGLPLDPLGPSKPTP